MPDKLADLWLNWPVDDTRPESLAHIQQDRPDGTWNADLHADGEEITITTHHRELGLFFVWLRPTEMDALTDWWRSVRHGRFRRRFTLRLEWKPADCWIGWYTARKPDGWHVWVCLLPMLPLHLQFRREVRR